MSAARSLSDASRRYAAELVGTAVLVLGGVGTAVLAPQVGPVGIALAFGLTLLVLAFAIGPVSGAHVNPAVTLGMTLAGRLSPRDAVGYVVAQVVGGIGGAALVYAIAQDRRGYSLSADGLGANGWNATSSGGYGLTAALVAEVALTALLVFVVLCVTAASSNVSAAAVAGIPIGLTLAVIHLIAIPIDGTSVNPARSIGPALFARGDALSQLWLFLVAPLVGGLVAVVVYRLVGQRADAPGGSTASIDAGSDADPVAEVRSRHEVLA